nr:MAG TPA: hypothetical protein [Caudoviricetes sp.]
MFNLSFAAVSFRLQSRLQNRILKLKFPSAKTKRISILKQQKIC